MGKRLITVADVVAAAEAGRKSIPAPPGQCIVTPGALDQAANLGIVLEGGAPAPSSPTQPPAKIAPAPEAAPACPAANPTPAPAQVSQVVAEVVKVSRERLGAQADPARLAALVKELVCQRLAGGAPAASAAPGEAAEPNQAQGVTLIDGQRLTQESGAPAPVGEKVLVAGALGGPDQKLSGGYMAWEKASFRRTVECPEIGVVLEGELHLTVGGNTMRAKPGDMVYFPQGVKVLYSAPDKVRLACVNAIN